MLGITYFVNSNTLQVISFFPLDEQSKFTSTDSSLTLDSDKTNDAYEFTWTSTSISDKNMYLRQDVSLLFDNGILKGAFSKWKQNTDQIEIKQTLSSKNSSLFQVISFHHGEIHSPDDQITSIHHMSEANLYVINTANTEFKAFSSAENQEETTWKNLLDRTTKQQLLFHWNQLFNYFDIDSNSYIAIPLTNLYKYNNKPLASMSQSQSNQIIGQLWEGLYKNYVIPAANSKKNQRNSYIPIVLFDKKQQHLRVLFELNGKKQQLIQKYPDS